MRQKSIAILLGALGAVILISVFFSTIAGVERGVQAPSPALPEPTQVQMIVIQNFGQEVLVDNTLYDVENAVEQKDFYTLVCSTRIENEPPPPLAPLPAYEPRYEKLGEGTVEETATQAFVQFDVFKAAYEDALKTQGPVYSTIIAEEPSPPPATLVPPSPPPMPTIDILPIATTIAAVGLIAVAVWIGYRQAWGDATSTLLERGLHDMTVRDVEIVGYIMQKGEFTIPELMKLSKASKITVWRTVQKLVDQGLVEPTDQTKPAANGLGGRGKPSQVYRYVGKRE
jgi:uncharacterized membrane protein